MTIAASARSPMGPVLRTTETRSADVAAGSPSLEVRELVKEYGAVRAVDRIDFAVRRGEVFAFLGPNGAGKTTTVEVLEGLRRPSSGTVRVLGLDPWTEMDRLRCRIGVVPQDFHFFPTITPREAIRLYAGLFGCRADPDELLARVELREKADARYATLSGGQHQKLGIALALVNDPEVCFLDEPTTGLDPRARRSVWELIRRLRAEGRTVFLTTHYLEEAERLADRLAIIHLGRIVVDGSPAEIIRRFGGPERLRITGEPALAETLRGLGHVPTISDGALEIPLASKEEAIAILRSLAESGRRWESFSTRNDTLEDVFLRLVGPLEDGAAGATPRQEAPR